jgi:superfamily I DNA and/or RNA helicase
MPTLAQGELQRLLHLLKTEKEEDLRQYELYLKNTNLQQRKQAGLCWYPVEIKETGYGLGDYPYIVVERPTMRDTPHQFSGGKLAGVFTNNEHYPGESVNGTVHFVSGNTMKIVLGGNELPDWISEGKIGVNVSFDERSYREMEEAVKRVIKAEDNRLAELREIILGDEAPRYNKAVHAVNIPSLNDSQNQAVNKIMSAIDIAVMHGPPGTGKTTTLVQAIKQLSKTESTILVCAPSNAAVDLLTERLSAQGLSVVRVGNLARVDEEMLQYTLEGRLEGHTYAKDVKRLKKQADEYRRMATKYKRQFGREEREQRNLLLKEARNLVQDATKLEDYAVMDILNKADVVTCTLVGSVNRYLEGKRFETVVIDEAAQALEPATWIPIAKANKVILAGDPFQLPPTVKSVEASKAGLSTTLIEKCLNRLPEVSLLNVQYRMHEAIMGFSNREFYNNELRADASVAGHTIDLPDNAPLVFIDTAGCSFDEKQNPETQSLYNPGEFDILRKHLDALLAPAHDHAEALPDIGIISPYREQVKYMQEQLAKDPSIPEGLDLDIDTIDSFQGQERDVIYISLVRSNEKAEIGFLADYRRMNVAMTRARKKLVIIGDSATLGQHRFYRDFLEYVEDVGAYHSAWEWMNT